MVAAMKASASGLTTQLRDSKSGAHWCLFWLLLITALLIRLACFEGYEDLNPRAYAMLAHDLSQGSLHIPDDQITPVFPVRIGAYAPAALLLSVFGISDGSLVGFGLIINLLSLVMIYTICRIAFGPGAGLVGLALLAFSPLDASMASRLFPHAVAAFWANLGMCLVWLTAGAGEARNRRHTTCSIAAGIAFGLSWITYESVVYLIPATGLILAIGVRKNGFRRQLETTAWIGFGASAIFIGELAFLWFRTGDLLYRMHATERNYEVCSEFFFTQNSTRFGWEDGGFGTAMINRLFLEGPHVMLGGMLLAGLPLLGLVAAIWAFLTGRRQLVVPAIWLVTLMLLFNFMTTSFESYKPLPLIPYLSRYLCPLLFPAAVLIAGALASLTVGQRDRSAAQAGKTIPWLGVVLFSLAILCTLPGLAKVCLRQPFAQEKRALESMSDDDVLFTDMRSAGNLIYLREGRLEASSQKIIPFEEVPLEEFPPGSLVLVNQQMRQFLIEAFSYRPPQVFDSIPEQWEQLWSKGPCSLYRVRRRSIPTIDSPLG